MSEIPHFKVVIFYKGIPLDNMIHPLNLKPPEKYNEMRTFIYSFNTHKSLVLYQALEDFVVW